MIGMDGEGGAFEQQILDTFTYDEFQRFTDVVDASSGTDYTDIADIAADLSYDPDTLEDTLQGWSDLGLIDLENGQYSVTLDGHIAFGLYEDADETAFETSTTTASSTYTDIDNTLQTAAGHGQAIDGLADTAQPTTAADTVLPALTDPDTQEYRITQYIAEHENVEKTDLWDALDISNREITETLFDLEDDGIVAADGTAYTVPTDIQEVLHDQDAGYDVPAEWLELLNTALDQTYDKDLNDRQDTSTDGTYNISGAWMDLFNTAVDHVYSSTTQGTPQDTLDTDDTAPTSTSSAAEQLTENQQILRSYIEEHGPVSKDMLRNDLDLSNREIGQNLRYLREGGELTVADNRYNVPGASTEEQADTTDWDDIDVDGLREALQNSLTRQLFEDGTSILTGENGSKKQVVDELEMSRNAVSNHYDRLAEVGVFDSSGPTHDPTYEISDAAALYDTLQDDGWDTAMDRLVEHSSYPAAFNSREDWDTFLAFAETFRRDGNIKDAANALDVAYATAKRRYDALADQGFFEQEGWANGLEYHVNDTAIADFAVDVERETLPSMIVDAVRAANHIESYSRDCWENTIETAFGTTETDNLIETYIRAIEKREQLTWDIEEIPDALDIVPQWEELLGFGYTAARDGYWGDAKDELDTSQGTLKRRLETLEEKGVIQEDADGETFVFDESLKPVFEEYQEEGKIFFDPDQLTYDDIDAGTLIEDVLADYGHLEDVLDDEEELQYLLDFAEVGTQTRRGVNTVATEQGVDRDTVEEYYDTLAEKGLLDRNSTNQQLIFDESLQGLLEDYADLDDHPNAHLQFRDITAFRENREQMQELEGIDDSTVDTPRMFTDYDTVKDELEPGTSPDNRSGTDPQEVSTPDYQPLAETEPAELVERIQFGDISGQDLETLESAVEWAIEDADRSDPDTFTTTTNQAFEKNDLNLYMSSPQNRESSYVMLPVELDSPLHIEKEEYDRFLDRHTDLSVDDDHLLLFDYDEHTTSSFGLTPARDILGTLPL